MNSYVTFANQDTKDWQNTFKELTAQDGRQNIIITGAAIASFLAFLTITGLNLMYCANGHPGFWDLSSAELLRSASIIGIVGAGSALMTAVATYALCKFGQKHHEKFGSKQEMSSKEIAEWRPKLQNFDTYKDKELRAKLQSKIPDLLKYRMISTVLAHDIQEIISVLEITEKTRNEINEIEKVIPHLNTPEKSLQEQRFKQLKLDLAFSDPERIWQDMEENFKKPRHLAPLIS